MGASHRWGQGTRLHKIEQGKSNLLKAAITCLTTKGVQSTTMQDVADAACVSRRTVYRYFPGKSAMLREVASYSEIMAFNVMEDAAQSRSTDFYSFVEEALVAGVDHYLKIDVLTHPHDATDFGEYSNHDDFVERWRQLLSTYPQIHGQKNPDAGASTKLNMYAEIAALLLMGHCQLQSSEHDVRESFKKIMALATGFDNPPAR